MRTNAGYKYELNPQEFQYYHLLVDANATNITINTETSSLSDF